MDELATLFQKLLNWHEEGHRAAIATVVRTWGSSPRRPGAHLIIREDGLFEGSVSGGCVEGDVIANAAEVIAGGTSRVLDYGVEDAAAWEVGLACGGRISVLVQPVTPRGFPPELVRDIIEMRRSGRPITVATDLVTGISRLVGAADEAAFIHRYDPPLRLAIVGAVHIAQSLAEMARAAGHAVTIIDPRTAFATEERFTGCALDQRWPDEALADWIPDPGSAVVTLTHDPKLDDPALIAAVRSPAYYVAALGSRKTHAARLERLRQAGVGDMELARIHGPAGLGIGALSPAEIAVSILAQMIAALRSTEPTRFPEALRGA